MSVVDENASEAKRRLYRCRCFIDDTKKIIFLGPLCARLGKRQREIFIDNLQVRIQFVIVMIRWTGLAPWEF